MTTNINLKKFPKEYTRMRIGRKFLQLAVQAAGCAAVITFAASGFALTLREPGMSLEQMTKSAEEIVMGNVVRAHTKIVGSHLETDYDIQVYDNLKSQTGDLRSGRTFTITLPGGSIQEPPLTQYAVGTPYMFKGEEVVLFLKKGSGKEPVDLNTSRDPQAERSTLHSTYRIVGYNQGRFSVVTRGDTGEKVVTRVNLENFGLTNGSESMQQVMRGIASTQIPTLDQPVVRTKDVAGDARDKDPLEVTEQDQKMLKLEGAAQQGAVMQSMRQRGGIPAQDVESFKAQIQNFTTSQY